MKRINLMFIALFILLASAVAGQAASLTLAWDPSPSTDVVGYKLYYKVADAQDFTGVGILQGISPIDLGNQLTVDLDGLADNTLYTFVVTSYDNAGLESPYSNEVSLTTDAAATGGGTPSLYIPALFYPANQASGLPTTVAFDWNDPSDGRNVDYTLVFGTDPTLTENPVAATALPGQTSGVPFSAPPTVALVGLLGLALPWRKRVKGVALGLLLAAALLLPACGGSSGSLDGGTASTGGSVPVQTNSVSNITASTFEIANLQPGTTYYWKIVADDGTNVTSSDIHSFTTAAN